MSSTRERKDSVTSKTAPFQHEPLDYRNGSIRLLRILPQLSHTGLIQCEIWHDSVHAKYDCLSYVWGSEAIQHQILINRRPMRVRENLWNFMHAARTKHGAKPRTLWVDALCIDQDSIYEKNHQVAQMGSIYSQAGEVISWLGLNQSIGRALAFASDRIASGKVRRSALLDETEAEWKRSNARTKGQLKKDWLSVVKDRYWTRAWITQEIFLAPKSRIMVNDLEMEPSEIAWIALGLISYINDLPGNKKLERSEDRDIDTNVFFNYVTSMYHGYNYLTTMYNGHRNGGTRLINLFSQVPGRQSYYVHDRIYSLLSLASDASSIKVDYGCSRNVLLQQILAIYKTSMCICWWFYIVNMLDCRLIPDSKDRQGGKIPIFRLPVRAVESEFVMGEDPDKWHDSCAACGISMPSFDAKTQFTFCIKSICLGIDEGHFCVLQDEKGKYTVRRNDHPTAFDVVHFGPAKISGKKDIDAGWNTMMPNVYDVFITGDVMMKLFRYPEDKIKRSLPLNICTAAVERRSCIEFCGKV
ncbi:hypothetical protein DDE82_005396 [Stemphylium lycopersici]|uniref:Heterokaryon incompatibility domain-containing protein n=1 Tax=Stemphylium lycopersici TaxID=183478 RepID=A0A364N710_STELY|nr:hypothetical protein TW65_05186 [Stemphylium lycopersici]RAR03030.1 hypothetical protein DDE82_005396 [Stemphylium lycopersici]RAR13042.1 hypothetical protein DDE83_003567 [Stemphylium lycopersici]